MSSLDSRTKLALVLLFTLLIFIIDKLPAAGCLLLFSVVIRIASGVSFFKKRSHNYLFFKNLTLLAAFIILIQTVFGPGDSYILKPLFPSSFPLIGGMASLKWEGLILGIVIVIRLTALVIILPVFTETTSPYQIASGLSAAGLNYRTAFIITMAFNLIYLFKDEAMIIMDAQKLRGMESFDGRITAKAASTAKAVNAVKKRTSFFSRLKAYVSLLLPLMLGAMKKAQNSSIVMDSRAFGVYKKRTWIDKPVMKSRDFICITGCLIIFSGILFINFFIFV